jgi:hypothetical protein
MSVFIPHPDDIARLAVGFFGPYASAAAAVPELDMPDLSAVCLGFFLDLLGTREVT